MATYYIPNESGWQANGGGTYNTYLRAVASTSYNASTNRTTVTVTLQGYNSAISEDWAVLANGTVTGNGTTLYTFKEGSSSQIHWLATHGDTTFRQITSSANPNSWSFVVQHADDGTATFTVGVNLRLFYSDNNVQGHGRYSYFTNLSGSIALSEPRASDVSASSGYIGNAIPITVTRKSTSYTHTVTASCLGQTATIASGSTSANLSWTPAVATYAPLLTSAMSTTATITCKTYSGSTLIGSKSVTITLTLKTADVAPSLSLTIEDAVTSPKNITKTILQYYGAFVATKSRIKVTTVPTLRYGASTASTSITANGQTYSSSPATTSVISSVDNTSVIGRITDSRQQSASASSTITILAYDAPKVNAWATQRCADSAGTTLDDAGAYCKISYDVSIKALNSHNSKSLTVKYKRRSDAQYTESAVSLSAYTASGFIVIAADTDSSYDIALYLEDDFGTTIVETQLSTAYVRPLNFKAGGRGIGIGKVSERDDAVELNAGWELYFGTEPFKEHAQKETALRGIEIPSNSDLDDYITPGDYYIQNGTVAATIAHNPYTTGNSRVRVMEGGSTSWIVQVLTATGNAAVVEYRRQYDVTNETFSAWVQQLNNSAIGTRTTTEPSAVSVSSGSNTEIATVTLPAGTWIIHAMARFASNATGYRKIFLLRGTSTSAWVADNATGSAVNGDYTFLHISTNNAVTASTAIKLMAYQNSGSALSVTGRIYCTRII